MHDCRQTQAQLPDLACAHAPDAARLRAALANCPVCHAEYHALAETLRSFDRAAAASAPPADFWPGYHARLSRSLHAHAAPPPHVVESARLSTPAPRWRIALITMRRVWTTSLRVPAPVALATMLALIALGWLALRPAPAPLLLAAPPMLSAAALPMPPPASPLALLPVAAPAVRARVVTRIVYVPRVGRAGGGPAARTRASAAAQLARRGRVVEAAPPAGAQFNLAGFQPAGAVQLRVIKGSFEHEQ